MKIILIALFLCIPVLAGEDGPADWEYGTFLYSVNIESGDSEVATIVGPEFPEGIRVLRDFKSLGVFKMDLIRIVDALNATEARKKRKQAH